MYSRVSCHTDLIIYFLHDYQSKMSSLWRIFKLQGNIKMKIDNVVKTKEKEEYIIQNYFLPYFKII